MNAGFARGRGRPRQKRPEIDKGTPELSARRREGLTQEPLDLCLERGLIDTELHAAAMYWRWLYCLKYGVPGPTQLQYQKEDAPSSPRREEAWKAQKSYELQRLTNRISREPAYAMFVDACLFARWPRFLIYLKGKNTEPTPTLTRDLQDLRRLLAILSKTWRK